MHGGLRNADLNESVHNVDGAPDLIRRLLEFRLGEVLKTTYNANLGERRDTTAHTVELTLVFAIRGTHEVDEDGGPFLPVSGKVSTVNVNTLGGTTTDERGGEGVLGLFEGDVWRSGCVVKNWLADILTIDLPATMVSMEEVSVTGVGSLSSRKGRVEWMEEQ